MVLALKSFAQKKLFVKNNLSKLSLGKGKLPRQVS
jgi:hypothetical protein